MSKGFRNEWQPGDPTDIDGPERKRVTTNPENKQPASKRMEFLGATCSKCGHVHMSIMCTCGCDISGELMKLNKQPAEAGQRTPHSFWGTEGDSLTCRWCGNGPTDAAHASQDKGLAADSKGALDELAKRIVRDIRVGTLSLGHDWDMSEWEVAEQIVRHSLAALRDSKPPDTLDETCWLIERGDLCLGFCEYRFTWVTFTDENALRFSRQQDAYSFMEAVKWKPFNLPLEGATTTEHMWVKP